MKISSIRIKNYRSIEDLTLEFKNYYTVLSGKNDSGKSNIIKAIRAVLKPEDMIFFQNQDEIVFKDHFPIWKKGSAETEKIEICLVIDIEKNIDSGLYKFLEKFSGIQLPDDNLRLSLTTIYSNKEKNSEIIVSINDNIVDQFVSKEIVKKIQTSKTIFCCNLTEPEGRFLIRKQSAAFIGAMSVQDKEKLDKQNSAINITLTTLAKKHKKDIEFLFGRLSEQYDVGLSIPKFNLNYVPFDMTLGDKHIDVPLEDWGSGTRNKTSILLAFLKAKQIKESEELSKITPIFLIEEPESFLHPSAQAVFGRLLQELAEENQIQIISTTHSPYFLSQENLESNILLDRKYENKKIRETFLVSTSGDNWMEPYALSLGIINNEFEPWKKMILKKSNKILMVEGDIDVEYFEMLKDERHENNSLGSDIEIYSYGGKDNLNNQIFLKFLKNKHSVFITFDLDAKSAVIKSLTAIGLKENINFCPIGNDSPGEDNIEGLLPDSIKSAVNAKNTQLVSKLTSTNSDIRKSAKQTLKSKYLAEFKLKASPGKDYYYSFYKLTKIINKSFNQKNRY